MIDRYRWVVYAGGLLAAAFWCAPPLHDAFALLTAPQQFIDSAGPVAAASAVIGTLISVLCAWAALVLLLAAWTTRSSSRTLMLLWRYVAPRAARRAAIGLVGLIALTPLAACAQSAEPTTSLPSAVATTASPMPAPAAPDASALDWPVAPSAPPTASQATTAPSVPAAALPDTPGASSDPAPAHMVQPGECLWSIAAQLLGTDASLSQVDAAVSALWQANLAVIGPEPDYLFPGQLLAVPDQLRTGSIPAGGAA